MTDKRPMRSLKFPAGKRRAVSATALLAAVGWAALYGQCVIRYDRKRRVVTVGAK